ncbi:hypothetical protein GJ700_02445 [Duganella sp. FT92W]|uniref:Uncharacterized protein n=1 Tax=Pseudoduganella rivuli TaxID=2666085 RepID=A0A7X2LR93_9BURK|nr:hypothetical protein [Pseudoduganella rivuli]MRV70578.1 hypothetical protein [Pseudoduganella rivuli]
MKYLIQLVMFLGSLGANAQENRIADSVTMEQYLTLLQQIAPAAREGANAYIAAYRSACGRSLTVLQLRRAVADGAGDPALMKMIHAAEKHDTSTIRRLAADIRCVQEK